MSEDVAKMKEKEMLGESHHCCVDCGAKLTDEEKQYYTYRCEACEGRSMQIEDETRAVLAELPGGSTPSQYGFPKGACELQDLIEHRNMNFAVGNIFKACYRLGTCSHSDELRDLRKILWFAERELKRLEGAKE